MAHSMGPMLIALQDLVIRTGGTPTSIVEMIEYEIWNLNLNELGPSQYLYISRATSGLFLLTLKS